MSRSSNAELLVLLGVRLKGFGEPDAIASAAALPAADVELAIADATASGFLRYRAGSLSGYVLTAEGRKEGERLLAEELDEVGARPQVEAVYQQFRLINPRFLELCAREPSAELVPELRELHGKVVALANSLSARLARFSGYIRRFATALEHVEAGELYWIASPRVDSYHSIWFELHENLLATLGVERSTEAAHTG